MESRAYRRSDRLMQGESERLLLIAMILRSLNLLFSGAMCCSPAQSAMKTREVKPKTHKKGLF